MKKGDIIKVEGYLGFLKDPEMEVLDINTCLVTLRQHPFKDGGLLSEPMGSKYGIDMLKYSPVDN